MQIPRLIALSLVLLTSSSCLCFRAFANFEYFQCRAMQSEAKAGLKAIVAAQQAFHAENGRYGLIDEIGFAPETGEKESRYQFVIIANSEQDFLAEARGLVSQGGIESEDIWQITSFDMAKNSTPGCTRPGE